MIDSVILSLVWLQSTRTLAEGSSLRRMDFGSAVASDDPRCMSPVTALERQLLGVRTPVVDPISSVLLRSGFDRFVSAASTETPLSNPGSQTNLPEIRPYTPQFVTAFGMSVPSISLHQLTKSANDGTLPQTKGGSAIPVAVEELPVTISVTGVPLTQIISTISEQSKVNVVLLTPSEEKVTLRLTKVRLIEAIKHLCAVTGLAYLKVDGTFLMGDATKLQSAYPKAWAADHGSPTTDSGPTKPTSTEGDPDLEAQKLAVDTVRLNYVSAESMANTLKSFYEKEKLVVSVGPGSESPNLGTVQSSEATGISGNSISSEGTRPTRTILLRGPAAIVAEAKALAMKLDVQREQVSIAVTISDVSDDALKELGIDYTFGGTSFTEIDPKGINFGSFTRTPLGLNAAISALQTRDKAKILASTNISVMDQERAFMLIGNKINLPRLDRYDANGTPVYTAVEYKAGIYLQVSPSISDDGWITLSLYPQVSTIAGFNDVNGAKYPNIATREAQTTLRIRSGDNLIIGGLMRNDEIDSMSKVPIFGDIPILGELFKRRRTTKTQSQVIISLTPTLVIPRKQ